MVARFEEIQGGDVRSEDCTQAKEGREEGTEGEGDLAWVRCAALSTLMGGQHGQHRIHEKRRRVPIFRPGQNSRPRLR